MKALPNRKAPRRLREREGQSKLTTATINPPTAPSKGFGTHWEVLDASLRWKCSRLAEADSGSDVPMEFLRAVFHEIRRLDRDRWRILREAWVCRRGLAQHTEAA